MGAYSVLIVSLIVIGNALNKENSCRDNLEFDGNNITTIIEKFTSLWPVKEWIDKGHFVEEYICEINVHWLSFGPPKKSSFIIFAVIYLALMLLGISGNFLVIFLFVRCKSLRTPGNTLILNLAISDGLMHLKAPIFIYNCFHMGPILGDIACRAYGFFGGLTGIVSIVTLSAISFDRYFMIKFPLNRVYNTLRVKICLIVIWLYGLTFSIIPALDVGLGKYTYEGYLTSCSFDYLTQDTNERYFIFIFFIAAWVVPLVLITFCYINIAKTVGARSVSSKEGRDYGRHVQEESSKRQEIKLAFVLLGSICVWFLAWTPYAVVALLGISGQKHVISPLTSMIPAVFCKTASCINPFVYALSHPKFKSELKKMVCGSESRSREISKVWSVPNLKSRSNLEDYRESFDVEEEMVELGPEYISYPREISYQVPFSPALGENRFKEKPTKMEMFCLPPNFTNKSSTFRKLSRKWSTKEEQSKGD